MKAQEALEQMKELSAKRKSDWEMAHSEADKILVRFILELGYEELVIAYGEVGKWYA